MSSQDQTTEQMIIEKGLTAPRVTKKLIDSKIVSSEVIVEKTPSGSTIYIGLYLMSNGFSVTGKAVIVDGGPIGIDSKDANFIISHVTKSGSILRFAYIELPSGLIIIGRPSASVSAENDDEEIGTKIAIENCKKDRLLGYAVNPLNKDEVDDVKSLALENAYSEIWALEGYLLSSKIIEHEE